jgi:anti-sigma-K factor RskA
VTSEEIRELAAVYALGGLDGEDRERFEALLRAADPEAASALRDFQGTVQALAGVATVAPPAGAKQALLERVGGPARTQAGPSIASAPPARPAPSRQSWWPIVWAAAMAAGLAAIAVGLSLSAMYERRLERLAAETRALRVEGERLQGLLALVRDPGAQVVALAGLAPAPSARARMIWNAPKGGLLVTAGLPPAPSGKAYQLWAIQGTNAPVSAGVFEVGADGAATLRVPPLRGVDRVDVFAVTLEPAGGVSAPTGQMYLAGKGSRS